MSGHGGTGLCGEHLVGCGFLFSVAVVSALLPKAGLSSVPLVVSGLRLCPTDATLASWGLEGAWTPHRQLYLQSWFCCSLGHRRSQTNHPDQLPLGHLCEKGVVLGARETAGRLELRPPSYPHPRVWSHS